MYPVSSSILKLKSPVIVKDSKNARMWMNVLFHRVLNPPCLFQCFLLPCCFYEDTPEIFPPNKCSHFPLNVWLQGAIEAATMCFIIIFSCNHTVVAKNILHRTSLNMKFIHGWNLNIYTSLIELDFKSTWWKHISKWFYL